MDPEITTPETPEVETPTPAEGAGGDPPAAPPGGDAPDPAAPAVVPVPAAYQPNLTFKVRDGATNRQIERKFDDWLHPLIKDAETEKKVREMQERAYGLDAVKGDRERLSNENQTYRQQLQEVAPTLDAVRQIAHFRDQKNLPAVFELLGLDRREVFQWAYQYANMTPEARQQADAAARGNMEAYGAQHQMSQAQQQAVQQAQEFKQRELGMIMRYDQQVSSAAAEFDQAHGPNAFIEHVKRTGDYYWRQGRDISVDDAVREVMKLVGRASPAQPQQGFQQVPLPGQGAAPQATQVVPPTQKPVIPSVTGTGSSPVKRVYRSMDDIKKRRRELDAANE